jgi:hypothetical protein
MHDGIIAPYFNWGGVGKWFATLEAVEVSAVKTCERSSRFRMYARSRKSSVHLQHEIKETVMPQFISSRMRITPKRVETLRRIFLVEALQEAKSVA